MKKQNQEAFAHEIQRESIARRLDEAQRGGKSLDADAVRFVEAAWRKRK